jgi:hypothetical protein
MTRVGYAFSVFVRAIILLAAVLAVPGVARAEPFTVDSFMTVLSSEYSISGHAISLVPGFPDLEYSLTSGQPRTETVAYSVTNGAAYFQHDAQGGVTSDLAWVEASLFTYALGNAATLGGTSSASITFQPLVSWLALEVSGLNWGYGLNDGLAEVFDETAGQMVLSWALSNGPLTASMPFNMDHTYTIRAVAESGLSGDGARLQVTQVPEPGTLILFGVGLVGMGVARRSASRAKKEPQHSRKLAVSAIGDYSQL